MGTESRDNQTFCHLQENKGKGIAVTLASECAVVYVSMHMFMVLVKAAIHASSVVR